MTNNSKEEKTDKNYFYLDEKISFLLEQFQISY